VILTKVTPSELFDILDLNKNGVLSRLELHEAAQRMGWYWREAPVLAVLDLFTVAKPMSRDNFIACMNQIKRRVSCLKKLFQADKPNQIKQLLTLQ
jgi:hypothetical protein